MRRSWIERIRDRVRVRQYDMTAHAIEEAVEDGLDIIDVEQAVLTGRVVRIQRDDPRGNKYSVEGTAADGATRVGLVGRLLNGKRFLIITVYRATLM